jgi:hypothetical protein
VNVGHTEQQRSDVRERRLRQMLLVAATRAERRGEEKEGKELREQASLIAPPNAIAPREPRRTSLKLVKAGSEVTCVFNPASQLRCRDRPSAFCSSFH